MKAPENMHLIYFVAICIAVHWQNNSKHMLFIEHFYSRSAVCLAKSSEAHDASVSGSDVGGSGRYKHGGQRSQWVFYIITILIQPK